jgi:UBX domain-containing protein 1
MDMITATTTMKMMTRKTAEVLVTFLPVARSQALLFRTRHRDRSTPRNWSKTSWPRHARECLSSTLPTKRAFAYSTADVQLTLLMFRNSNVSQEDEDDTPVNRPSRFTGAGQTLGGDGTESRRIPDPQAASASASGSASAQATPEGPPQERILHLWDDGFSIDDGELRRFDDPENRNDLAMIRAGRAPLHLMNVRYDQRVDVKLQQHEGNWHQLPKIYRPFGGEGRRLGSPVPGDGNASNTSIAAAVSAPAAPTATQPTAIVDESQPTLMLRIQLPNGTRLPARFNTTQTVGDIYEFVSRAWSTANSERAWVVATTFPNKEHTNRSLVLGEMQEFKKGGTAVVKWA